MWSVYCIAWTEYQVSYLYSVIYTVAADYGKYNLKIFPEHLLLSHLFINFAGLDKDHIQEFIVNKIKVNKEGFQFLCTKTIFLVFILSSLLVHNLSNLM